MSKTSALKHIGFIVDGNRRWAKKHGLPTYEGHLAGYNALQDVVKAVHDAGIEFMTAYIFSTENWKRSEAEVKKLMDLVMKLLTADLALFDKYNVKLKIAGSRDNLDSRILKAIENAEAKTANYTAGTLALCFNYGGQLEIADAVKKIIKTGIGAEEVTPELIGQHLYVPELPPVDLIVRTSGEQRISNFMLWRAAYSEMMFIDKFWPDMTKNDIKDILKEYNKRSRRFGG